MTENLPAEEISITDDFRWNLLQRKAAEVRASSAFAIFRQHGIEPILIKGLAAALNYPETVSRESIDMDLAVSETDFEAAKAIAESAEAKGLAIDLHRELRHLDTVAWADLFRNSHLMEFATGEIRVLRPEDHLRVLCVHWLTDGGSNKSRLWDIYYAIKNRAADFDWDRFLNVVDANRRRWLVCTLGLADRYLDLDLRGTPVETEARDLPNWLTKTVEREWASETHLVPLEVSIYDLKTLLPQIKRRLRANPIWATLHMNGSFDAKTRFFYKIGSAFKRIPSSYHRISETLSQPRSK